MESPVISGKRFSLPAAMTDLRRAERWRNSNLVPTWLWRYVICEDDYSEALGEQARGVHVARRLVNRALRRLLPFWPRVMDAVYWSGADESGPGRPDNYAEQTEDIRYLAAEVAGLAASADAPVLDLGCNCGRCLASVADLGLTNLHGVDININAISRMIDYFPILDKRVNATRDFMQRYLDAAADRSFDIVFTRGATVELVHPSYPLIANICRISREHVVLVIRENGFSYPRDWIGEFESNGFLLIKLLRPLHQCLKDRSSKTGEGISLMVFSRHPAVERHLRKAQEQTT
tara:strand:+ start:993 stop:1865 length:873 start_codon:yes stop_codon:yes gene_type:complete